MAWNLLCRTTRKASPRRPPHDVISTHHRRHIAGSHGPPHPAASSGHAKPFAEEEASFWDFLDVINPLQHLPILSTLYRQVTGDEMGYAARMAGHALFGGPIGLVAAFIETAVEDTTGKDLGEHFVALFEDETPAETMLA
ncbi:MAG: hypothetical protein FD149_2121 [Rhodospirillaceae bacterium]|nr:MAG: hypothetical protein FD149_2121 [Rhodospirillaceae bacterium]